MNNQDSAVQHATGLIDKMLRLGERILAPSDGLEQSKEVLSLMEERTRLFKELADLEITPELVVNRDLEEDGPVNSITTGDANLPDLLKQLYEQNELIRPVLLTYLGLIDEQVQLGETSLKAAKSYGTSDHLRSIARGLNVDKSL